MAPLCDAAADAAAVGRSFGSWLHCVALQLRRCRSGRFSWRYRKKTDFVSIYIASQNANRRADWLTLSWRMYLTDTTNQPTHLAIKCIYFAYNWNDNLCAAKCFCCRLLLLLPWALKSCRCWGCRCCCLFKMSTCAALSDKSIKLISFLCCTR